MVVAKASLAQSLQPALDAALTVLERDPLGGYAAAPVLAAEPIAWATQALAAAGRVETAMLGAEWLAEKQQADGSVGVTEEQRRPAWTTALAVLAWHTVDPAHYAERISGALDWAVVQEPWTAPSNRIFGHDTTLEGWSWAADTHSWLEPTAFFVKALHTAGRADDPRAREGVRLLADRLLPSGGANYGNTVVLGQELLQHVQSSGVVAWALAETEAKPALARTLDYLHSISTEPTGVASLCWATLGLAANGVVPAELAEVLRLARDRALSAGGVYKPALYANACLAAIRTEASADV